MGLILSPWFWIVVAIWTGMAAAGGWHQGSVHIQGLWDKDKLARMEHLAQIVVENTDASNKADADARLLAGKTATDFAALEGRTLQLRSRLAAINIDAVVADRVRDAIRTANAEAPPAGGVSPNPPAAAPTTGGGTTGLALAGWSKEVGKLYRACREEVTGFNQWWDDLKW